MFDLVQIIYWLALSTWFGGVLFIAVAAPVIMRVMQDEKPVLPGVLSVNLEGQHGQLLGGGVIGRIMEVLFYVELACAVALLLTIIAQWFLLHPSGPFLLLPIVRTAVYLGAVGMLIYHWRVLWPRMWRVRQEYIDNADNVDVANAALDRLDRFQSESATVLFVLAALLLGMIAFSANIRPAIAIPTP